MTLASNRPLRTALLWGVPGAVLAMIVGVELYSGRGDGNAVPPPSARAPAPINVGLLPAYTVAGGPDAWQAIGEHTLFNPTRKPAPPAEATANGRTRLQRGQFLLTGTQVFGDKAVAYLKSTKDGKPHTVRLGDTLEGMRVANITSSGVRLAVDGESEDLVLKVATGPKTTVQPATAAPPQPAGGATTAMPGGVPPPMPTGITGGGNVAPSAPQTLAERRRAARARQADPAGTANQPANQSGTMTGTGNAVGRSGHNRAGAASP